MSASKSIQYPAQTGFYKVFVKDKGHWQNYNTARLQISVGNPKHDGDKFYALAEWAAARFENITLIISDTLQRHNIALYKNLDHEQAYDLSFKMGDYWIRTNKEALSIMPSKTITRWDDWLCHPNYQETFEALLYLYNQQKIVKAAIDDKALEFSVRQNDNLPAGSMLKTSIGYILEEVAAFSLMFLSEKAIDVYPGDWFKEIFEIIKNVDSPLSSSFKNTECLRVDFVRNGALFSKKAA